MRSRMLVLVSAAIVLTLALPVSFVVQTLLADELTAPQQVFAQALMALILITLVTGLPRSSELRELKRGDMARLVGAGLLGVLVAPYLVLANRHTDAPPGSEVLFFTTAAWGMIVVLGSVVARTRSARPSLLQVITAAIALLGAAAVLANWERPSSFSPFVRYPSEHLMMLLAGCAWAGFTLLVAPMGRRYKWRVILPPIAAAGSIGAAAVLLLSPRPADAVSAITGVWPQLIVAGSTSAAILISWSWLVSLSDTVRPAALLYGPPVTLTLLGIFERTRGTLGPNPILWDAVTWACLVTTLGALGVAILRRSALVPGSAEPNPDGVPRSRASAALGYVAIGAGGMALVAAVAALIGPARHANVVGTRSFGAAYEASWTIPGAEMAGVVIATLAILCGLVAALGFAFRRWSPRLVAGLAAGLLIVLLSVPTLSETPLRTWTRWIPADVQQDYGTEYARLTTEPAGGNAVSLAILLGGVGLLSLAAAAALESRDRPGRTDEYANPMETKE